MCVNRENGTMALDPFKPYPVKSYMAMELLQGVLVNQIKEKNEEAMRKARRKR